jgi:bacillithiol system protein YtxJ
MTGASRQAAELVEIEDAGALEEMFARSNDAPVVLFKHSTTCPISAHAHRQMSRLSRAVSAEIALVVVQRARAVSNQVAERTGVRHESPQVIVLRGGKPVWSASHYDIATDSVESAVRENA